MLTNHIEYISLGSQCNPALTLSKLNLKGKTNPFDWVRSNPKIIYDVLINGEKNYLDFESQNVLKDYYVHHIHQLLEYKNSILKIKYFRK